MKKVILFAAVLFSSISIMNVQAQDVKTGESTLTINLSAVQSIEVNGKVVIDYTTADEYEQGKGSDDKTKLKITSAGRYSVKVSAADLQGPAGAKVIAASTIGIAANLTSTGHDNGSLSEDIETTSLKMSNDGVVLINSATGGSGILYDVSYKGMGTNEYYKNYNSATDASGIQAYTTQVIYEITAQ